jgi:hypothetical protein
MKAKKYFREVADTYCLLSSFLRKYHHDTPDAMVALQEDVHLAP